MEIRGGSVSSNTTQKRDKTSHLHDPMAQHFLTLLAAQPHLTTLTPKQEDQTPSGAATRCTATLVRQLSQTQLSLRTEDTDWRRLPEGLRCRLFNGPLKGLVILASWPASGSLSIQLTSENRHDLIHLKAARLRLLQSLRKRYGSVSLEIHDAL